MFLTLETLKRLNACEQGTKYIERFYPNGAELIDIINDKHISKEFLHWGREHLTVSEEELRAYCHACRIETQKATGTVKMCVIANTLLKVKMLKIVLVYSSLWM